MRPPFFHLNYVRKMRSGFHKMICGFMLVVQVLPAIAEPASPEIDLVEVFQEFCLDTELNTSAILSMVEGRNLDAVSEAQLFNWSQGVRPYHAAGYLLSDHPFTMIAIGLQGEVKRGDRGKLAAGQVATSLPVSRDHPIPNYIGTTPENMIGTKTCSVVRVGEGRAVLPAQVSTLSRAGTPLGPLESLGRTSFDFPAGRFDAVISGKYSGTPYINFIRGHDAAGVQFVELAASNIIFADDDPGTYRMPEETP